MLNGYVSLIGMFTLFICEFGCIYLIKNKNTITIFMCTLKCNVLKKLLHGKEIHSDMLIWCSRNICIIIIITVEKVVLCNIYFLKKHFF